MTQNARTTFWEGINATGIAGRAPQRPNCGTGQSFEVCEKSVSRLTIGSRLVVELVFNGLWPRGLRRGPKRVGQTLVKEGLALLGSLGHCAFAHSLTHWNVPKKYGPHGELFFYLLKNEPVVLSEVVEFCARFFSRPQ